MKRPKINQTRKEHLNEIIRCGSDPVYFIEKYVKISHPTKGSIPFELFPYQIDCLQAFLNNNHVITNKSRQLGLSTLAAAYSLWMAIFQREKNVLVIATKLSTAQLFVRKVKGMFKSLPSWLVVPNITSETNKSLEFDNGSKIHAIPTSPDAGRGEAVSLLIIDEAGWIADFEDLWIGLQPTLSTGGDVILISSPSGVGTRFHKIWVGAQDKTNDFYPIELPWFVHPEHNEKWFEEQSRAIGSQRGINSELLCKFEGSGNGFVDEEQVSWLEKSIRPPLATYGPNQNVWIWRYQVPNHKYIIGADVARGDGEDFSSFYVIDMDESEVVCEFKGQLPADDFGRLLADIGGKYNNAVIIAEQQGGGIATNLELKRLKYPKVFYEKFSKEVLMGTKWLSDVDVEPYTPGLMMSVKSRNEGLVKLEQALRKKTLKIYSGRFVEELKTFIWHNNKAQAMKGYNDDLVMSLAITLLFFDPQGDQNFDSSAELARAMIAAMSVNQTTVKTFETQRSTSGWGAAHSTNPSNAGHFGGSSTDSRVMNSTRTPHWQNPWGWLDD